MAVADRKFRFPFGRSMTGKSPLVATGLALTLGLALLLIYRPLPVVQAELGIYDLMLAGRRAAPSSSIPVLVGIDDESLAAYGQWPWPRYRLAMLVDRLHRLGAEVIVLDFLMPEPDRSSPEVIRAERKRDGIETAGPAPSYAVDGNTRRLAAALGRARTVLAFHLDFAGGGTLAAPPVPSTPARMVLTRAPGSTDSWPVPTGVIRGLPPLTAAAAAEGFTNSLKDSDGTLRRTPLLLMLDDRTLPSLALAAALMASADRNLRLVVEGDGIFLHWNRRRVPLDRAGNMLLDFRNDPPSFPYYSARAVLQGTAAVNNLRGKTVFVGSWATGLGDLHLAPTGKWIRGVEVHATVLDNLATGRFLARPRWADGAELVALLILGAACTLLLSRTGFRLSLAVVVLGSVGCYAGARQLLVAEGLYLSPLLPMLTPIVISTVLSLLKYGIEARKVVQGARDLIEAQDEIIVSMSVLSEARDRETGLHILRTQRYVEILARQLARLPQYAWLNESRIKLLAKSAPLHDIGKIGIADDILHKPGKLSAEEYAAMKSHTVIGAGALTRIVNGTGHPEKNEFLTYAREMTVSHHEHWDGSGYPNGLKGEAIPLAGRLMALADVYDALVSPRVYKDALTHDQARDYIRQQSGAHFDPDVVDAFLARENEFFATAREYSEDKKPETMRGGEVHAP